MCNRSLQVLFRSLSKYRNFTSACIFKQTRNVSTTQHAVSKNNIRLFEHLSSKSVRYLSTESGRLADDNSLNGPRELLLLQHHPHEFSSYLKQRNISRCYLLWNKEKGSVDVSHGELQQFADWFNEDSSGYRQHEAIFMQLGIRTGVLMAAFLSNTKRGQAVSILHL